MNNLRYQIATIIEIYDTYDCEGQTCPEDIDDCDLCIADKILQLLRENIPAEKQMGLITHELECAAIGWNEYRQTLQALLGKEGV